MVLSDFLTNGLIDIDKGEGGSWPPGPAFIDHCAYDNAAKKSVPTHTFF